MKTPTQPTRAIQGAFFEGPIGPITAAELVAMPEDEWGILRDRLTDGSRGKSGGLVAKCMRCNGEVFIKTRRLEGTPLPLFEHYRGGDPNCPWYQGRTMPPDSARAAQYQGQQESLAHRRLCEKIDELVRLDPRYIRSSVGLYHPPTKSSFGRYPDVYVEWMGCPPFAIELQLSKTFQTEISGRSIYYEREGVALIWVLYGVEPDSTELPQSFRDVVRRHRGNAFVLDREAIAASNEQRTLVLKCYLKNAREEYDAPLLVRLDALTFPKKGLPYSQDRITEPLRQRIRARRKFWFKAFDAVDHLRDYGAMRSNEVTTALTELKRVVPVLTSWGYVEEEDETFETVRLLAVVFSVLATANGRERNYATRHPNIRAMLNTLLNIRTGVARYALLLEEMIVHTSLCGLINGTVGEHIETAKQDMEGNLCVRGESEWEIMAHLVPEIFDPVVREQFLYLDALPAWATPGVKGPAG